MKQLTGLDAGFLYMETPTTFGHISSLALYEQPPEGERWETSYDACATLSPTTLEAIGGGDLSLADHHTQGLHTVSATVQDGRIVVSWEPAQD